MTKKIKSKIKSIKSKSNLIQDLSSKETEKICGGEFIVIGG